MSNPFSNLAFNNFALLIIMFAFSKFKPPTNNTSDSLNEPLEHLTKTNHNTHYFQ